MDAEPFATELVGASEEARDTCDLGEKPRDDQKRQERRGKIKAAASTPRKIIVVMHSTNS